MAYSALIFVAVAVFVSGCLAQQPTPSNGEQEAFKHLSTTLPTDFNPLHIFKARKYWFNNIPLTQTDAQTEGWSLLEGSDCSNGGRYAGVRYLPPTEKSIAALYDSNGVIAGIQTLYRKDSLLHGSNEGGCKTVGKGANNYDFDSNLFINTEAIDGIEYYVLTAYFAAPETICQSTRDPSKVGQEGFGTSLYIQAGASSSDYILAPETRALASSEGYTNNTCLPLNGYHNFFRSELWDEDECKTFRPYWLFYDSDKKLSGFGFSLPGCDGSWRFQHPPGLVVNYVVNSKCAKATADTIKFSNINIYLRKPASTALDCVDKTGFMSKVQNVMSYLPFPL